MSCINFNFIIYVFKKLGRITDVAEKCKMNKRFGDIFKNILIQNRSKYISEIPMHFMNK